MDSQQTKEVKKIISDYLEVYATDNQYGVSKIPYHTHNGTDSPLITTLSSTIALSVSDGTTTVAMVRELDFVGATVTDDGNGIVTVTISAGAGSWQYDGTFSSSSNTVVAWTSGTLIVSDGTVYSISSGTTGTMSSTTYIYFDPSISTTAFQVIGAYNSVGTTGSPFWIASSADSSTVYVTVPAAVGAQQFSSSLVLENTSIPTNFTNIVVGTSFVYASNATKLYKFNVADMTESLSISNPAGTLTVALSPDEVYLYAVDFTGDTLYKFNTSNLTQAVTAVSTGSGPISLVVSPDGLSVYVATVGGGLSALQKFTASNLAAGTFTNTTGGAAKNVSISPSGANIYVTQTSGNIDKFNTSVSLITNVAIANQPYASFVSPNNSFLYVVTSGDSRLYKLNATTLAEVSHVSVGTTPHSVTASPDGSFVYVGSDTNTIQKYNASDLSGAYITPSIVGADVVLVADAQNVAATKNAIFSVFSANSLGGLPKLVTSADLDGAVGTITSGTWNGSVITPPYGGTGVANNASSTLTISGNFATTLTVTGSTGITLPTSGTLATLAGTESLTNKKLGSLTTNGFVKTSGGDGTLSVDTNTYLARTATVTATGQVADIGSTNLTTTGAGLYRLAYYLVDTVADLTAGAVRLNVTYTDSGAAQTQQSATVALITLGAFTQGEYIIQLASGNIAYSTTHTGIFGTSAYNLYITLERLN